MISRTTKSILGPLSLALLVAAAPSCISTQSDLGDAADGCPEFETGEASANVDASVKGFIEASQSFQGIGVDMKASVRTACANIATDLGADDTWSDLGDGDRSISNDQHTGACDIASSKIAAIMDAEASIDAHFALSISRGACHPDFELQAACDAQCKAQATCDSGTVETRCQPGDLSVKCEGSCVANAYCEGTVEVAANCMGACESTCQGECKGTCVAEDGTVTNDNPNCHGKCSSACNGTCRGLCKVEAEQGIDCGASVSCRGGCEGSYTAPTCETMFLPPKCTVDQACLDACSAEVAAHAVCDPPTVELHADVNVSAEVKLLVETINENLPALIAVGDAEGKLALEAAGKVVAAGELVVQSAGHLDGKSVACAATATEASVRAAASIGISVRAGGSVTETCGSRSN